MCIFYYCYIVFVHFSLSSAISVLSANPTKWSNTLKQFFGNTRCVLAFCGVGASRVKTQRLKELRIRNAAFEMQVNLHIGVHKLDVPLSSASKLFLSNLCRNKRKQKFRFIQCIRNKAYEVQVAYLQNLRGSLICFLILRHL